MSWFRSGIPALGLIGMAVLPTCVHGSAGAAPTEPAAPAIVVAVDAARDRHPISPLIYGVSYGTTAVLRDLGSPLNRSGGDSTSLYNWRIDARNAGRDWYFESLPCTGSIFDQHGDGFIALTRAADAQPVLTIPMIGWVAKLGPDRAKLASFPIGKYGFQEENDQTGFPDAGNGVALDGTPITGNDPTDAAQPDGPADEKAWIEHLVTRWGTAGKGGVRYYTLDNEPGMWHVIHRDVHPVGAHASEIADKVRTYAAMIKSVDPGARVVAPEAWGWTGYFYSGFDQQHAVAHGFDNAPDRSSETGGMAYLPWLLTQWKRDGHLVDVVSVHFYPQGGEYRDNGDDDSPAMQLRRNRSTRDLWDPAYKDPTWINGAVDLIPRLRRWVDRYYYPGTPIAITEYNWGGDRTMNGATTEADILGIFGRERLDMAARWAAPAPGTPTYLAMKLYRNADDHDHGFGSISVAATVPDPDEVSAFAALRPDAGGGADTSQALTVMVINKQLQAPAATTLTLAHFPGRGTVTGFQLAAGRITRLPPFPYAAGTATATVPAQSVTLFVLHGQSQ